VNYVTIARIEAGTFGPRLSTLEKLARALDVSVQDLLTPSRPKRRSR
jgi:predicted transcriptional regulator